MSLGNEMSVGGQIVPNESAEGISNISSNKTLMVTKLNDTPKNEVVDGIETIDEAFEKFKPKSTVSFQNESGGDVTEQFTFNEVGDFSKDKLVEQSAFLKQLQGDVSTLRAVKKHLSSNRALNGILQNKDAKEALVDMLKSMLTKLEDNK
jgi:predicted component of type VI protein secretion system